MGPEEGRRGPVWIAHGRVIINSKGDVKSQLQPSLLFRFPRNTAEGDGFDIGDFFLSSWNHLASVIGLQEL